MRHVFLVLKGYLIPFFVLNTCTQLIKMLSTNVSLNERENVVEPMINCSYPQKHIT